jgi:hypothetical protein
MQHKVHEPTTHILLTKWAPYLVFAVTDISRSILFILYIQTFEEPSNYRNAFDFISQNPFLFNVQLLFPKRCFFWPIPRPLPFGNTYSYSIVIKEA